MHSRWHHCHHSAIATFLCKKKNDKSAFPPSGIQLTLSVYSIDLRYNTFDIELFAAKSMRGRVSVVDEEI